MEPAPPAPPLRTIAVIGATGRQGGGAVKHLMAAGSWRVRAVTRHPDDAHARALLAKYGPTGRFELAKADCMDKPTLVAAFTGAHGVFGVTNPFTQRWTGGRPGEASMEGEEAQGRNLVDACIEAGVAHLVFSSVASALENTQVPTFEVKVRERESGCRCG